MPLDLGPEVALVLPFDLGHGQEAVNPFIPPARQGMPSRRLILPNVAAFQLAGAVHRSEPTGDVAKEPESSANEPRASFAKLARGLAQIPKHDADQAAVMPLLLFNLPDAPAIFSV
jgi:hypothetical protein